ncbi:MFS transporter [Alicycliphilus denitrificans]|uniref:Major facilitator superfamily MFS_1 n=2 Tax=Alicycliphilus denitrificans TaxID=179636 RepID=F4GAK5_ALIDK|nr:MFS transporter [Alicycliphilus denitrificans]ADU99765.1 major facilitator superfamily MFS_1 [Alicycliphilus denitrificans BC]AEB84644.1 major facilitator superfamily MFS_1 [Alicycliphilus denitrificans K601]QKD44399.1 MFS transporter [Alicycliphilus denitrificans]GAO23578.1 major facilitator superfamily protein [Alicycliphilus sp. B1]
MTDSPADSNVYRHAGFIAFLTARLVAVFATQVQAVVVAWQVYDLTRAPMALAYVGLAQFLPMLVLLLPAGDLIDRFSRKPILAASWAAGTVCSALLWWLAGHGAAGVDGIYAVLVLFGCSRAFSAPALSSLLPQIVPRGQLAQAVAANGMIMRMATIGGPFLGGVLYAVGGARLAYAVCMACFALGTLLLARVAVDHAAPIGPALGSMFQRFGAGIRFIRSRPIILGTISLDLFAVLLGGVVALLPIYAQEVLHVGPQGLGALRSAMAIGEVGAGLYLSMRPFDHRVGRTMFAAVAVFGLANLVFSLSTVFALSFAALMVAGAADMVSVYIRGALVQFSTPDEMRGRVNAVNMLFIGSSNELGEFRAGTSAAWVGAVPAAVLGGLCTLGVVGLWARLFPTLRRVDKFEEAA